MVNYKNQHYVPEFYFKLFSKDQLSINFYNIGNGTIRQKGYKKLCAESYFYTDMPIFEESIAGLENAVYGVIVKLINGIPINEKEYFYLLHGIVFQISRTKKEKSFYEYIFDKCIKSVLNQAHRDGELWKMGFPCDIYNELDKYTIKAEGPGSSSNPHMTMMYMSLRMAALLADLKLLLLVNNTSEDFVFSDNPIVLYNKFFLDKRNRAVMGFASHGLQIFFPLSPRVLLVLYDEKFYDFKVDHGDIIIISTNSDVESLNTLQLFNCSEYIFFQDNTQGLSIQELHSRYKDSLSEERFDYEWYIITSSALNLEIDDEAENGKTIKRWIIIPTSHTRELFIRGPNRNIIDYNLELSFMRLKESPKWDGPCRDPELLEECDRILDQEMAMFIDND